MASRGRVTAMRLAVIFAQESANARYRAILPLLELERRGHTVCWPGDPSFGVLGSGRVPPWDLLHVQQFMSDDDLETIERLRGHGIAVVWDSDDDIGSAPKGSASYQRLGGKRKIRRHFERTIAIARAAHLMTTTNERLAQVYRDAGVERVQAIENHLGREDLAIPRRRHQGIVIGITAAGEHEDDLRKMRIGETLQALLNAHDGVRVVAIGADLKLRDHRYTHVRKVPIGDLLATESEFDVGLAPLRDTPFNRARSDVKLKEYAAAGAMWLASPVGPYVGLGEREGGLLVADGDWLATLSGLVQDHERRLELTRSARAWAARKTIEHGADAWQRAFRSAILRARQATPRTAGSPRGSARRAAGAR